MSVEHLFTQALGLGSPWNVVSCDFDPLAKSLELVIGFGRGARFADPETGELCPVHDTVQRSWEHLKFFEHRTTIHARVPRIKAPSGSVITVEVPWAKPHGGFTLLMEAFLLAMAKVLPVAEVSRQTSVISWCVRSRMKPFVKLGHTLKRHIDGILGYFKNHTTSAAIEAVNGLLQLARRSARGYRTFRNYQAIAYWIAGDLDMTRP
jgi:transposase